MTKALTPTEFPKSKVTAQKRHQKKIQRLQTDIGRSVGVTTATQVVG